MIGLSYYPFWHGTLSQLRANLDDLAQRYRRDVSVVETQYGWTLDNGDRENNFLWTADLLVLFQDGRAVFSKWAHRVAPVAERARNGIPM